MEPTKSKKSIGGQLTGRKAVALSGDDLVASCPLSADRPLPLVFEPSVPGVRLAVWVASHRDHVYAELHTIGAILFRGFAIENAEQLEEVISKLTEEMLEYRYRSTPRREVSGHVYTSTEYPADQWIPMHNEMSYTTEWPRYIWFLSQRVAARGGETPIADSRRVYERIAPELREKLARKGVMYVRNYGGGLDLAWQDVFQTEQRAEVEDFCRRNDIDFEWWGEDRLRTRQVCQAVARHPLSGEMVWFNQAHLFHVSSLAPEVQASLHASMEQSALPRNTYYGDGTPIEPAELEQIRAAYAAEMVLFPWCRGDVLMLDNMLVAHGRAPFEGERKVLVGMAVAQRGGTV